ARANRHAEQIDLRAGEQRRLSCGVRHSAKTVRTRGDPVIRDSRRARITAWLRPIFVRRSDDGNRLAIISDADSIRRCLPWPLQVQPPADCRLPESLALPARSLSA